MIKILQIGDLDLFAVLIAAFWDETPCKNIEVSQLHNPHK